MRALTLGESVRDPFHLGVKAMLPVHYIIAPVDAARIGFPSTRATLIGDPNLPSGDRTPLRWFNTVSFTGLNTTVRCDAAGNPAGGYGPVTSAAPGRVLEFGVRMTF